MDILKKDTNNKPGKHVKTSNCSNAVKNDDSNKAAKNSHTTDKMENSHHSSQR